ncbi:MAG: glycosyltransferase [Deltaproteobacteria bacterium]|nr:glycosyltransferase [Deltaproteobacteria bacterium]
MAPGNPDTFLHYALIGLYIFCLGGLFLYGTNCYVLLFLFRRNRNRGREEHQNILKELEKSSWSKDPPLVTVQLPVYNERYVIQGLLKAVCALDYPRNRLEIQLLDDSTDDTGEIASRLVAEYQAQGVPIVHSRRANRHGFKAGALKEGLEKARGEFLAIFDADFVPPSDFLRKTIPYFLNPKVGMVQVRWDHINAHYSLLTRAQSIGIDAHFSIEQGARAWSGLFLNFNGSAGIWRRQAIRDAGGWQADTLTEDMDLSYRSQLAGWQLKYLLDVNCPAELPVQVAAFKSQQFRWAKGSIQTARKILPALLKARCSWFAKYQAILHMTHYMVHLLMLGTVLLSYPAVLLQTRESAPWLLIGAFMLFLFATLGPSALYVASQEVLYPDWRSRILWIPLMTLIGTGIALSNSRAVLEGLLLSGGKFVRTPKYGTFRREDLRGKLRSYWLKIDFLPYLELVLGFYTLLALSKAVTTLGIFISPFLFMYTCGFFYISCKGVGESLDSIICKFRWPQGAKPAQAEEFDGA